MAEPVPEPVAASGPLGFLPADPRTRALTVGGVVVALLLLLFVASRLLFGGGGDAEPTAAPPVTAAPTGTTTTTSAARPAESFETFSTKNPFTPLIGPIGRGPVVTTPPTGGTRTPTTIVGGGGGTGTGTGTPTTARGGTGPGGTGGTTTTVRRSQGGTATEPRRSQRVALLDVFTRRGRLVANVRVNDTVHTVGEGDEFAGNYKVVSLSAATECGRFLFGDTQFRLCRGEETLK